jgi:hypothetical protein
VTKIHFAGVYSTGDNSDGQTSQPITQMHLRGTSGVSTKFKSMYACAQLRRPTHSNPVDVVSNVDSSNYRCRCVVRLSPEI